MQRVIQKRNEQIAQHIADLPGNAPYDNYRPINVPARFDGQTLFDCLVKMHPHVGEVQWRDWFLSGHILEGETPVAMRTRVRGGQQFVHLFPDWVEPAVDLNLRVVWEDESIIAVHKPAPLPVHPSGRFNRNTTTSLLRMIYQPDDLRVVHRLDANTTGVLLFARTADIATSLREQFDQNRVEKRYLVLCDGLPNHDSFTCNQSIAKHRGPAGSRSIDPDGQPARTEFKVLRRFDGGKALLEARPRTGRTHQIRIHLWSMRMPVIGDPAYLRDRQPAPVQTLGTSDPPMCLHAASLRLTHPASGERIEIEARLPNWLTNLE